MEKTSPRTVDGRPLTITRPTPPSRLVLRAGSRDVIEQRQQQLMLSWSRMARSQSLDNERRHVPRRWQMSRLLADNEYRQHGGLVVCVSTADTRCQHGCSDDSRAKHSRITYCDNSSDGDDRQSCQPRNSCSVTRRHPHQTAGDTSPRRFKVNDVEGRQGDPADVQQRQSRLIVDYDDHERQLTTHTQTDSSLAAVQRAAECCATSDDCHHHQQQQAQEASKKRQTLSCVGLMADFSGLLRRLRRLRVGRTERQHETRV